MSVPSLSLTEWVVLALLAERPAHGFAVARELRPDADLGRIITVHRPLVYRALARLVEAGLAESHHTEPGDAGPNRTVHRPTRRGRAQLRRWFELPVEHVRDLRIEFLVKLRLTQRAGRGGASLVSAQRDALALTLSQLADPTPDPVIVDAVDTIDVVDLWRKHNAVAARDFLDALSARSADGTDSGGPTS